MEERRLTVRRIEITFWVLAALFLALFSIGEFLRISGKPVFSPVERMGYLLFVCALLYTGGVLRARRTGQGGHMKFLMFLFAVLYLYLLLTLTLTEETFGRGDYSNHEDARAYYMKWFVNFRPFRSIYQVYVKGYRRGYVDRYYVLLNLIGNLCAFLPAAVFLPYFFRLQRRWYIYLPTVILCVCAVEGLQFWMMVGSCDVDDLILNAGGAFAFWWILRIPPLRRFLSRAATGFAKNG